VKYIWVTRWEEFQHYRPDPKRGPAWIKAYTAQLDDERYLALNDKQRCVLHELRIAFANTRGKLPKDTRFLSRMLAQRVTEPTLQRLNQAGFIEFVSRPSLERRLDLLYSRSRSKKEKKELKAVTSTTDAARENGRTERPPDFKIPENLTKEMPL
jgi:hypothetical protein